MRATHVESIDDDNFAAKDIMGSIMHATDARGATRDRSQYDLQWIAENLLDFSSVPRARIFCVPHAGGAPSIFSKWPSDLGPDVEVCAISLPGRGARFNEPFAADMLSLAVAIANAVAPLVDVPFALYGECSGALVCLAVAHMLKIHYDLTPTHLFAVGLRDPRPTPRRLVHLLSDAELRTEIANRGLLDDAIASNDDAMAFFLPQIRADYRLCETYLPMGRGPLGCPVTTVARMWDRETDDTAFQRWREESSAGWCHLPFKQETAGSLNDPLQARVNAVLLSRSGT